MGAAGEPPAAPRATAVMLKRSLGSPALFAIVWTSLASSIYFSLGVVAGHALGLTPLVFLGAGVFFTLTSMTYAEGASMHRDRAGSTVFARYAFNELVSFVAGWAILLDYVILIAICSLTATSYLAAFYHPLGHGAPRLGVALAIIAYVAYSNVRGFSTRRTRRTGMIVVADLAIQVLVIGIGLVLFFNLRTITANVHLGTVPRWSDVIYALTITTVAFTSLESAAGLSGEILLSRRGLKRLMVSANASVYIIYIGIALVAVTAIPVINGHTALGGRQVGAPVLGIVEHFHPAVVTDPLKYVLAAAAVFTLIAAANSAMLGLSRLAYSLSTNRQIPSPIGRLHPDRSTPYVLICVAALLAAALVLPEDLDFLVGIYAFGAMLAFTIAHLSICVLRFREPDREPAVPDAGDDQGAAAASLPLPAVVGGRAGLRGVDQRRSSSTAGRATSASAWMIGGVGALRRLPPSSGEAVLDRVDGARGGRCAAKRRSAIRLDLVPLFGDRARRRHRPDRRAPGRRRADRRGGDRQGDDRGDLDLPGADVAAARRPPARRRSSSGRGPRWPERRRSARSTAGWRSRRRRSGPGGPATRSSRRRAGAASRRSCSRPRRPRACAVGPCSAGAAAPGQTARSAAMTRYVLGKAPCRVILTAPPHADDRPVRAGVGDRQPRAAELGGGPASAGGSRRLTNMGANVRSDRRRWPRRSRGRQARPGGRPRGFGAR